MGVTPELARGAVRVSFGVHNTAGQVEDFTGIVRGAQPAAAPDGNRSLNSAIGKG
jgi:cysteine sulfinate desulfinase/cysteine desulfurase-like protein